MRKIWLTALIALSGSTAYAAPSETGPKCAFAGDIVALSDMVLKPISPTPRFGQQYGPTEAAYLKIAYQPLNAAEAGKLVQDLATWPKPPATIGELQSVLGSVEERRTRLTQSIKELGYRNALNVLGPSGYRAYMVDDAEWFFALLQAAPAADLAQLPVRIISSSLSDLNKSDFDRLIESAKSHQLWSLAYWLIETGGSTEQFYEFKKDAPRNVLESLKLTSPEGIKSAFRGLLVGTADRSLENALALPPEMANLLKTDDIVQFRQQSAKLIRVYTDASLIPALVNFYGGNLQFATNIAIATSDTIAAGKLDPRNDPDAIGVFLAKLIDRVIGHELRVDALSLLSPVGYGGFETVNDKLDRIIARHTLGAALKDARSNLPARPREIAAKFDWDRWVSVTKTIREKSSVAQNDLAIEAELLFAAGRPRDALAVLKNIHDRKLASRVALGQLEMLDARCGNLFRPATGAYPNLYRFPPEPAY